MAFEKVEQIVFSEWYASVIGTGSPRNYLFEKNLSKYLLLHLDDEDDSHVRIYWGIFNCMAIKTGATQMWAECR